MKVLIAEDEPLSRRLLQSHLEKWGHDATAAADGGDAWRLSQAGHYPQACAEYDRIAEGRRLLRDLREYVNRCQLFPGTAEGLPSDDELLGRLDRQLATRS